MKIRCLAILVLLTLALSANAASSRPDPKKALAGLDAFIERELQSQKIAGAAVAVVAGDEVVLLKGYGWRDLETKKPVTPDTMFPIASITKQLI